MSKIHICPIVSHTIKIVLETIAIDNTDTLTEGADHVEITALGKTFQERFVITLPEICPTIMKYRQLKAGPALFHSQLKSCCLSETIEATKASTRAPPSLSSLPPRRLTHEEATDSGKEGGGGEDDRQG